MKIYNFFVHWSLNNDNGFTVGKYKSRLMSPYPGNQAVKRVLKILENRKLVPKNG